jgi:peroxin-12
MSLYTLDSVYRPSFFECIAADKLIQGLKPAFKYLLANVTNYLPSLNLLSEYNEEIFYTLLYCIESHYLSNYNSSFSENFYGLRRVKLTTNYSLSMQRYGNNSTNSSGATEYSNQLLFNINSKLGQYFANMRPRDRSFSLLYLIIFPYLKAKLDRKYNNLTQEIGEDGFENVNSAVNSRNMSLLTRCFIKCYPYFHSLVELTHFLYQLQYLFEFSIFYSPQSFLLKQVVRRISMEDMQAQQKLQQSAANSLETSGNFNEIWSDSVPRSFLAKLSDLISKLGVSAANYAKFGILIALFTYKFLEWYNSPSNSTIQNQRKLPIPPAALPPQPRTETGVSLPADKTMCALCERERTNPACSPSGYVFCYPCIFAYVQDHSYCPITMIPCNTENIRKIYES